MKRFFRYLRDHKWLGRIFSGLVAIILGMSAAIVFGPIWVRCSVVKRLSSPKPQVRAKAIEISSRLVGHDDAFYRRLRRSMANCGDVHFFAAATALEKAGMFERNARSPHELDRMRVLQIENFPDDFMNAEFSTFELLKKGKTIEYISRAGKACLNSNDERIKNLAPALAALCDDDSLYGRCLDNGCPQVQVGILRYCGLAGKKEFSQKISDELKSEFADVRANAVFALTQLDTAKFSEHIKNAILCETDNDAREIMQYSLIANGSKEAGEIASEIIDNTLKRGEKLSITEIRLIGQMKLLRCAGEIRKILDSVFDDNSVVLLGQLHAGLLSGDELGLGMRDEVYRICKKFLGVDKFQLLTVDAIGILGRQIRVAQESEVSVDECMELLSSSAVGDMEGSVASAAAAAAYWINEPDGRLFSIPESSKAVSESVSSGKVNRSAALIMQACGADNMLCGDHIAWQLAGSGNPLAFEMGMTLLPSRDAEGIFKVYNPNARAAGAMLLALCAKTPQQKKQAVERIKSRLLRNGEVIEDSIILADVYRCALVALGVNHYAGDVRRRLGQKTSPVRSSITALLAGGDEKILSWMLCNRDIPPQEIVKLMVNYGLDDVFRYYAPSFGTVDRSCGDGLRIFQAQMMCDRFVLSRRVIVKAGER